MQVFAIYDSVAKRYMRPFFMRTQAEALRGFTDVANDDGHEISQHPTDFSLMVIGEWDETNGNLTALATPHRLATAMEVRHTAPNITPLNSEASE